MECSSQPVQWHWEKLFLGAFLDRVLMCRGGLFLWLTLFYGLSVD